MLSLTAAWSVSMRDSFFPQNKTIFSMKISVVDLNIFSKMILWIYDTLSMRKIINISTEFPSISIFPRKLIKLVEWVREKRERSKERFKRTKNCTRTMTIEIWINMNNKMLLNKQYKWKCLCVVQFNDSSNR